MPSLIPNPMFPNPPGLLRLEPHSEGLRERIWWGAASNATAVWAAENGMNLQSSTLKFDESGKPFHIQQAEQIRLYKEAWKKAGHQREPRVSVSRSIFALVTDQDRAITSASKAKGADSFGYIEPDKRAVFGKSYAAEPDQLIKELAEDEAIQEADTLLLTIPNTLGVDYNVHVLSRYWSMLRPHWVGDKQKDSSPTGSGISSRPAAPSRWVNEPIFACFLSPDLNHVQPSRRAKKPISLALF